MLIMTSKCDSSVGTCVAAGTDEDTSSVAPNTGSTKRLDPSSAVGVGSRAEGHSRPVDTVAGIHADFELPAVVLELWAWFLSKALDAPLHPMVFVWFVRSAGR